MNRAALMPPGFVREAPLRVRERPGESPPVSVLKRLPGALGWAFEVMQAAAGVTAPGPIANQGSLPPPPNNFRIPAGFEGLIDWISVRNIAVDSGSGVAGLFYAVTVNGAPLAGYEAIGQLKASDGAGNWWADCEEFVEEDTLIELWLLTNQSPSGWVAGGRVHGVMWPIRSRLDWEAAHTERAR